MPHLSCGEVSAGSLRSGQPTASQHIEVLVHKRLAGIERGSETGFGVALRCLFLVRCLFSLLNDPVKGVQNALLVVINLAWRSISTSNYIGVILMRHSLVRLERWLRTPPVATAAPTLWLGTWFLDRRSLFGGRVVAGKGGAGGHAGASTVEEELQETTKMPPSLVAGSDKTVVLPTQTVVDPGKTVVDPNRTVVVPIKTLVVERDLVVDLGGTTVPQCGMVAALRAMVVLSRKMVVQLGRTVVASAERTVLVAPWVAVIAPKKLIISGSPCSIGRFYTPRPLRAYPIRGPTLHRRSWHSHMDQHGPLVPGRAARPPPLTGGKPSKSAGWRACS
jgi:hypothetical protein